MQEKRPDHRQELICINVDKVYDWVVKENSFDLYPTGKIKVPDYLNYHDLKGATVKCDVSPDKFKPIVILERHDRHFCIDGKNIELQQLHIQKNFKVTIFVKLSNGKVFEKDFEVSRCEHVTLCAPDGTDVEVTYTELHCSVCSMGDLDLKEYGNDKFIVFDGLSISVNTCQSIQSTFPVTVEFLADYCDPREEIQTVCPPPMRPKQCSVLFPDDGRGGKCCQ